MKPSEQVNPFKRVFKTAYSRIKQAIIHYKDASLPLKLSLLIFGFANMVRGQIVKGLIFLTMQGLFILYFINTGLNDIAGLLTLGTRKREVVVDPVTGIPEVMQGDNSMTMLLFGVLAIMIMLIFMLLLRINMKSAYAVETMHQENKKIPGFLSEVRSLFDENIQRLLLFLPMLSLFLFTIVPLIYMISIAFTNFDANHQPPGNLFTWVGLDNFRALLDFGGSLGQTFWPIFGWTLIWAVFATFTTYFGGMFLALLINQKTIKFKTGWRMVFILTIAIPSFVSLMVIRTMLQNSGIVNEMLKNFGFIEESLPFFTDATWARVSVIMVNLWIGVPFSMLITSGILMNIPRDIYESASLDGANKFHMFKFITLPYMLFVTTPYLITNFIQNVNNFNAIYFLTGGGPGTLDYHKGAGQTDLLVTWLYKLTVDSNDYSYASAIGIIIFILSAAISLVIFRRTTAYKDEQGFM